MPWGAAAIVGGAAIGALSSGKASKDAIKGQEKAAAIFRESTERAGREIIPRFQQAAQGIRRAGRQNLNLLGTIPQCVTKPFQQGNIQAQQAISGGLQQQQNALLGLPTDLSSLDPVAVHVPRNINTQAFSLGGPQPQLPQPNIQQPNIQQPNIQQPRFRGRVL